MDTKHIDQPTWVYVITEGDAGPTKIGIAGSVAKRLSNLQCANPRRLQLVAQYLAPSKERAIEIESIVISQFRMISKIIHGEWLNAGPLEVMGKVQFVLEEIDNGTKQMPTEQPKLRRFRLVDA